MKRPVMLMCLCVVTVVFAAALPVHAIEEEPRPLIQMAILLDTSGSMSGLIGQAKAQLWKIVNEFIMTRKEGKIPELQVALYEYGNNGLPPEEGYIRMIMPLTNDLDRVSEELFALTTNGGSEYCGMVIQAATRALAWSSTNDDLKVIFIAGNEPFTQGKVDYRKACKEAITKGIVVNTIHCGSHEEGVRTHWKDGAVLADGKYMNIDQNRTTVHISAPQDKEIARLGAELNGTYLPYGAAGMAGAARQAEQDANAMKVAQAGSHVQRAVSKASAQYRNAGWDLVDALREQAVKLEELKVEDLPEEMQGMTPEERKAYVRAKAERRGALQDQINKLNAERKQYIAQQMKKLTEEDKDTFGAAVIKMIREQAARKNFKSE